MFVVYYACSNLFVIPLSIGDDKGYSAGDDEGKVVEIAEECKTKINNINYRHEIKLKLNYKSYSVVSFPGPRQAFCCLEYRKFFSEFLFACGRAWKRTI